MNQINAYRENAIATQSRGRLVVLLYDGAIKFLKQALKELEAGHFAAKGEYINKAVAIINELDTCLDMEAGGDVAQNLRSLYHFMIRHLGEANIHRDPQRIREVIDCLQGLNDGWKAVSG
ncbi:MAG: flagellar export chaperone FliS [Planctomycetota bacterium]|jgi:flagellar protein FliS|nr:flagellar export chaperone FliS [Planctomycetota bacterium]